MFVCVFVCMWFSCAVHTGCALRGGCFDDTLQKQTWKVLHAFCVSLINVNTMNVFESLLVSSIENT